MPLHLDGGVSKNDGIKNVTFYAFILGLNLVRKIVHIRPNMKGRKYSCQQCTPRQPSLRPKRNYELLGIFNQKKLKKILNHYYTHSLMYEINSSSNINHV